MSALDRVHEDMRAEWSRLAAAWRSVRADWTDNTGARFERERWAEWERIVPAYLRALEDFKDVVNAALHER